MEPRILVAVDESPAAARASTVPVLLVPGHGDGA
jgi:hypothetical protein